MNMPFLSWNLNLTLGPRPFGKGIIMLFWGRLNGILMVFSGGDSVTAPIKMVKEMTPTYSLENLNRKELIQELLYRIPPANRI